MPKNSMLAQICYGVRAVGFPLLYFVSVGWSIN